MWWHLVSQFQNGITLGYCKYFLKYLVSKIFFKIFFPIFWKNIFRKYFQYLSVIPFWNRETKCHHMALIKTWLEDFFFQHPKGGPFGFAKTVFAVRGGNFAQKKICKTRSSSNMSKNALLSASGWNPKLHIITHPYTRGSRNDLKLLSCEKKIPATVKFLEYPLCCGLLPPRRDFIW